MEYTKYGLQITIVLILVIMNTCMNSDDPVCPEKVKNCEPERRTSYLYKQETATKTGINKTPDLLAVNISLCCKQELKCELQGCGGECPQIKWIKEGSSEIIQYGNTLKMEYTSYVDVGRYHCIAEYQNIEYYGSFNVIISNMYVLKKPDKYNVIVERGRNQTFWCELYDRERTLPVRWEKEGDDLRIPDGNFLYLINATYNDTGIYHCEGFYNRWYNASFNVKIGGKPYGIPTIAPQNLTVRVNETFTLTCNASGVDKGIPESTEFIWTKDGKNITGETSETYVHKPEVIAPGIEYGCGINNEYGSSSLARTMLSIEAPIVIESPPTNQTYQPQYDDRDFNVTYIITGSNLINFTFSNVNPSSQPRLFKITNTTIRGEYRYGQTQALSVLISWDLDSIDLKSCKEATFFNGVYSFTVDGSAAGEHNSEKSTFSIDIQYPVMWNEAAQNESSPQCKPKTLKCDVCAAPAPTNYSWSFMGEEVVNATGVELFIGNTSMEDFGWYTCTVSNFMKGDDYKTAFNITLDEDGSPHSPLNFEVKSRTSRTLFLSWDILLMQCYVLEIELKIWNNSNLQEEIIFPDCNEQVQCEVRIMNLTPSSEYLLDIRGRTRKDENNWFYSEHITKEGTTAASPQFTNMEITISETSIEVRWKYGTETKTVLMEVTEDVTVVIYYKKSGDLKSLRHPVNGSIPAEAGIANIKGNFDTSASYMIEYEVYEGDQLAIEKEPLEIIPSDQPADLTLIVGIIGGVVIGVVMLSLLIFGLWYRRKKQSRSETKAANSAQSNDLSLADSSNSRQEMNAYENVAMEADETADSYAEIGPTSQVQTPQHQDETPMDATLGSRDHKKSVHGSGLAYVELDFEEKDEPTVQLIHGAENTVEYVDLDHDKT